jgi:hypothetical protein
MCKFFFLVVFFSCVAQNKVGKNLLDIHGNQVNVITFSSNIRFMDSPQPNEICLIYKTSSICFDTIDGRIKYRPKIKIDVKAKDSTAFLITGKVYEIQQWDTLEFKDTSYCFHYADCFEGLETIINNLLCELYETRQVGCLKKSYKNGLWLSFKRGYNTFPKDSINAAIVKKRDPNFMYNETTFLKSLSEYYQNGYRHGKYIYYNIFTGKTIYKTHFKQGTGYYKDFYYNETMSIKSEGQFEKGVKVGNWIYYDANGKSKVIFEGNLKNSKIE